MPQDNIAKLESDLWESADQLRANSKLTATEYSMPVLGLIFLRYATNRFYLVKAEIERDLPTRGGIKPPLTPQHFQGKAALYLPDQARYDHLIDLPDSADVGKAIDEAMEAVESHSAMLDGVLPKGYSRFEPDLLRRLLRIFNGEAVRNATGDVIGRIYEYFLNKFAMTGAQEGGEFFTPPSLVRTIVNVIEPDHGTVFDPAVGSAGMFVQTGYFLRDQGTSPARAVTFHGQERSDTNTRLARMNMAVHGLEGDIVQGNTYYDRMPHLVGACDFVMANPPFNVDGVDPVRLKNDPRLPFGLPGISTKTKAIGNANYLWIQYFYSYLNERGRAGFVMASSATDARHAERNVREELIKTGAVDVMIAIGTNFFYTKSLPCTLWFLDRGKPEIRRNKVLMIDARHIYRIVNRTLRDFTAEQLQNLSAIVWLYRGETDRYLSLLRHYLAELHEAANHLDSALTEIDAPLNDLVAMLTALMQTVESELCQGTVDAETDTDKASAFADLRRNLVAVSEGFSGIAAERAKLLKGLVDHQVWWDANRDNLPDNEALAATTYRIDPFVPHLRLMNRLVTELVKHVLITLDDAEKNLNARRRKEWNSRRVAEIRDSVDQHRHAAVDSIRAVLYPLQQLKWLQARFPDGSYANVVGLCKVVECQETAEQEYSLAPGRYVGVAPIEVESDESFQERIREIHLELKALSADAETLTEEIQENFEALAI